MTTRGPLRSKAGGAKRTPARYAASAPPSAELLQAIAQHRRGRLDEAVALYDAAIEQDAGSLDAWVNLGGALVRLGRARAAEAALSRAIQLGAHDARALRDAAVGLSAVGALHAARAAFEAAIAIGGAGVGARLGLARLSLELGERDAAIHHALAATREAPSDASSWLELHRARFDDRALGPAIDAATRAVELRPDYAIARFFLAGALRWDGAIERARPLLEGAADRAGALAPGLVEVLSFCEQHRASARATASKFEALTSALSAAPASAPVVELGVRHGVSTRVLASRTHATVHAFDSFAGLPTDWHAQRAGAFTTAGELPSVPDNVVFHVGLFEDTLPPFVADLQGCPGLVHFDSDLYESARVALAALGPRLGVGTVLCFDEYLGNAHWRADEHRAFTEAAEQFGWRWVARTVSWITGQASFVLGA